MTFISVNIMTFISVNIMVDDAEAETEPDPDFIYMVTGYS